MLENGTNAPDPHLNTGKAAITSIRMNRRRSSPSGRQLGALITDPLPPALAATAPMQIPFQQAVTACEYSTTGDIIPSSWWP